MIKKTKGIALGTVLVVLTFMIFLGTGMALLSHQAIRNSRVVYEVDLEWYALEGGLRIAATKVSDYVRQLSREAISPHSFAAFDRRAGTYGASLRGNSAIEGLIDDFLEQAQKSLERTLEEGIKDAWPGIRYVVEKNPINGFHVRLSDLGSYDLSITPEDSEYGPYFRVDLYIAVHTVICRDEESPAAPIELRANVSFRITTHSHEVSGFTHAELNPNIRPAGPYLGGLDGDFGAPGAWQNAHGSFLGRAFGTSRLVSQDILPDPNISQFDIGRYYTAVMRGANSDVPLISFRGPISDLPSLGGSSSIPLLFNYFASPVSIVDFISFMGQEEGDPDNALTYGIRTTALANHFGHASNALIQQNRMQFNAGTFNDIHGGWRSFASRLVFGMHNQLELRTYCPYPSNCLLRFCFGVCLQYGQINSNIFGYYYVIDPDDMITPQRNHSGPIQLPVGPDYAVFGTLAFELLRPVFDIYDQLDIQNYGQPWPFTSGFPAGPNRWALQNPLNMPGFPLYESGLLSSLLGPLGESVETPFFPNTPQGRATMAEDVLLQLALLRTVNQVVNFETIFGQQVGLPTPPFSTSLDNLVEIWQNPIARYAEHIVVFGDLYITPRYCTCIGDCPDPPDLPGFISPGSYNCDIMYFPNLRWLEVRGDVIVQFYDNGRGNAISPYSINGPIRVAGRWDRSGNTQRLFELNPGQFAYTDDRGTVITANSVSIERHPFYPVELWNLHVHAATIFVDGFFDKHSPSPVVFTFDMANRNDAWWLRSNSTFVAMYMINFMSMSAMWQSGWDRDYGFYPVHSRIGEPHIAPQFFSRLISFATYNRLVGAEALCRPTYAFFASIIGGVFSDNFIHLSGFVRSDSTRNRANLIQTGNNEHSIWAPTGTHFLVSGTYSDYATGSDVIFYGFEPALRTAPAQYPPIVPRIAFSTLPSPFAYHFVNIVHERATTAFFVDERRVPVVRYYYYIAQPGPIGNSYSVYVPDPSHWLFPHIGQTWGEVLDLPRLFGTPLPPRVQHWYQHLRILPDWPAAGQFHDLDNPADVPTPPPNANPSSPVPINWGPALLREDVAMQSDFRVNLWPTGTPLKLYPHDARMGRYAMDFRQSIHHNTFPPGYYGNQAPPGGLTAETWPGFGPPYYQPPPPGWLPRKRTFTYVYLNAPPFNDGVDDFPIDLNLPGHGFHHMPPNQLDSIFNHNNRTRHFLYRTLNDIPLPGAVLSPRHSYLVFTFDRVSDFELTIR